MNYRMDILYGVPILKPHQAAMVATIDSEPTWNGIPVHISDHCTRHQVAFDVIRNPRRRRRAYTVTKREWREPCAFLIAGGRIAVHPRIWEQLKLDQVDDPRASAVPGGSVSVGGRVRP